jgi:hypothetical protein
MREGGRREWRGGQGQLVSSKSRVTRHNYRSSTQQPGAQVAQAHGERGGAARLVRRDGEIERGAVGAERPSTRLASKREFEAHGTHPRTGTHPTSAWTTQLKDYEEALRAGTTQEHRHTQRAAVSFLLELHPRHPSTTLDLPSTRTPLNDTGQHTAV